MFRMWGKMMKNNRLVNDKTVCIKDYSLSRTQMVFQALEEMCYYFDLGKQSGWIPMCGIFRFTRRRGFGRIILLSI